MEINLWIKSPFSLETISRFLPLQLIPKYFTGKKSHLNIKSVHFYEIYISHVKEYEKLLQKPMICVWWWVRTLRISFYTDRYVDIFYRYICNIGNKTVTLHTFILHLIWGLGKYNYLNRRLNSSWHTIMFPIKTEQILQLEVNSQKTSQLITKSMQDSNKIIPCYNH